MRTIPALVCLHAQQTEQHLIRRALIFGVVFEAVALEILDKVSLAVGGTLLVERLGEWVAEDRNTAVALPVRLELLADEVLGCVEIYKAVIRRRRHGLERVFALPARGQVEAEPA